jgi:16S rRNA (uracil1498-N3)-methyltransferase
MLLFFSNEIQNNQIILRDEEHQHCFKVLRKKTGDSIHITDGKGNLYVSIIISSDKNQTVCQVQDQTYTLKKFADVSIGIAPTKNASRIEWFAEKAVEIGITTIYILITDRTEKKSDNITRLQKILLSAAKQSLSMYLPEIKVVTMKQLSDIHNQYQQKFIAHCDGPTVILKDIHHKTETALVLIGPEGDFTDKEIDFAKQLGFHPVSLGESRLRTETAGLVALMMMRY